MIKSVAMVEQSMADINANRTHPAEEAIEQIAAEFGLKLERRPARKGRQ